MVNVLVNPSFENELVGWVPSVWSGTPPYDVKFLTSSDAFKGNKSVLIQFDALTDEVDVALTQTFTNEQLSQIKPNELVTLSCAYKTTLPYARVFIQFFDNNWNLIKEIAVKCDKNDGQWQTASTSDVAPTDFTYIQAYCEAYCHLSMIPATCQFDDLAVEVGVPAPPPPPPAGDLKGIVVTTVVPIIVGWLSIKVAR